VVVCKVGKDILLFRPIQTKMQTLRNGSKSIKLGGFDYFYLLLTMDEKVLFYIILGIVYFIFSRLKKKPNQDTENEESEVPESGPARPKPVSFEDLLREISEAKQQPARPQARPLEPINPEGAMQQSPAYADYDDEIEDEVEVFERQRLEQERVSQVYEQAKKQAFSRPSLEETLQFKEIEVTAGRFKSFDKKVKTSNTYLKDLKDRNGFKRALIVSEILNRKQF
jgi:hypothetical protein